MGSFTISKALWLAALILFIIAGVICFLTTDVSQNHITSPGPAGLACLAAAPVVA